MKLFRETRDAFRGGGVRKMIEAAEEAQILAASKPSVEAEVAACMVTELAANGARVENGVVSRDFRAALGGQEQRGENPQQRGFTGAIRAQQCKRFAGTHFERNSGKGDDARLFEWLQKSPPAAACGGEEFFDGCNANRGLRHDGVYSVSVARRQSAREERQPAANRKLLSVHSEGLDSPVECNPAFFDADEKRKSIFAT